MSNISENDRFSLMAFGMTSDELSAHVDKCRVLWQSLKDTGRMVYHESCHKHAVIYNVDWATEGQEIVEAIICFYGSKSYWSKDNADGTLNIECYDNTSVMPRGKYPWSWCGQSVLWPDYQLGDTWQFASRKAMPIEDIENKIQESLRKLGM